VSKFQELCKTREESTRQFISYRDESWKFAEDMRGSLVSYLECPVQNICFVDTAARMRPTPIPLAIQFSNDGFWQFGLVLGLQSGAPAHEQGYYLEFAIKRQGPSFEVKLVQTDPDKTTLDEHSFIVARENPDFQGLNDCIFEKIKSYFDFNLDNFSAHITKGRPIGFSGKF
jgi:hypothetical protein